jgi:hypothetical protein
MKTVNSYYLKLTGKCELPKELVMGENYSLALHGTITSTTDHDNHDGTLDRSFKFEPVKCEVLNELGEVIKAKDTRGEGQKTRAWAYRYWEDPSNNLGSISFEDFYKKFQQACRVNLHEIMHLK